jgi:tetratricopeptide (TPR) repeat protein
MNNLATLRRRQGDAAAAESLWREALAGQRDLLGPEHLDTIATKSNLAGFLSASRDPVQLDEAELLFTRVVEVRRAVEGPGHPETLKALSGLGSVAFRRARFEVAETHFAEAFAGLSELLGPEHGSVVSVGGNLLTARRRPERAAAAESGLVEWIEAIEARVGPGGAPEARSLEIWSRLAVLQEQRGDHGAAASTLADAVRHARRRVVRAGDSEAIAARLMLRRGEALGRLGEYRSGADLLEEAHDILERELGRIHADVQAAALRLAEFHERWAEVHPEVPGTLEKARRWRERGEAP